MECPTDVQAKAFALLGPDVQALPDLVQPAIAHLFAKVLDQVDRDLLPAIRTVRGHTF